MTRSPNSLNYIHQLLLSNHCKAAFSVTTNEDVSSLCVVGPDNVKRGGHNDGDYATISIPISLLHDMFGNRFIHLMVLLNQCPKAFITFHKTLAVDQIRGGFYNIYIEGERTHVRWAILGLRWMKINAGRKMLNDLPDADVQNILRELDPWFELHPLILPPAPSMSMTITAASTESIVSWNSQQQQQPWALEDDTEDDVGDHYYLHNDYEEDDNTKEELEEGEITPDTPSSTEATTLSSVCGTAKEPDTTYRANSGTKQIVTYCTDTVDGQGNRTTCYSGSWR